MQLIWHRWQFAVATAPTFPYNPRPARIAQLVEQLICKRLHLGAEMCEVEVAKTGKPSCDGNPVLGILGPKPPLAEPPVALLDTERHRPQYLECRDFTPPT